MNSVDIPDVWYFPACSGAVNVLVSFCVISPVLNCPSVAVGVSVAESLLVTLTLAPGDTDRDIGLNMKLEMVTEFPFVPELAAVLGAGCWRTRYHHRTPRRARLRQLPDPTRRSVTDAWLRPPGWSDARRAATGSVCEPGVHAEDVVQDGDMLHLQRVNRRGQPDGRLRFQRRGLRLVCL